MTVPFSEAVNQRFADAKVIPRRTRGKELIRLGGITSGDSALVQIAEIETLPFWAMKASGLRLRDIISAH